MALAARGGTAPASPAPRRLPPLGLSASGLARRQPRLPVLAGGEPSAPVASLGKYAEDSRDWRDLPADEVLQHLAVDRDQREGLLTALAVGILQALKEGYYWAPGPGDVSAVRCNHLRVPTSRPLRRYVAVLDPRHGAQRPRQGLSDGFLPARVVADVEEGGEQVSVEFTWPHYYTERGHSVFCSQEDPWVELCRLEDVKLASDFTGPRRGLTPPGSEPELGVLAFRWGGLNRIVAPAQWGDTGSSVSEIFVDSFFDMAVVPRLGNNYEVWTVYIEDATDLIKLADSAHLIFGASHPLRRAKNVCAMYFLYPTAFEENCIPTMETGEDRGAAMVDQKSLFRLMKAIERAGIPTRFPHASGLYEQLASKSWTSIMSVAPHLRVPPTVSVPRMLVEQNCELAAEKGLAALHGVRAHQARLRGEEEPQAQITKGVAKLGYSWEALDVKFWRGQDGLKDALSQLTRLIEISGEMTGQPHDCESIMVQEFCEHDLELRAYAVEGKVEAIIFTKFCRIKENNEFGDFEEMFTLEDAANAWMGGDLAALQDGERQCREVTDHWLQWVQAQVCETPAAIRFDYFVGRAGPGKARIWTLEICELGFSMLGAKDLPEKVFSAMLRQCLGEAPGGGRAAPQAAVEAAAAESSPEGASPPTPKAAAKQKSGSKGTKKGQQQAQPKNNGKGGKGKKGGTTAPATTSEPVPGTLTVEVLHGMQTQKECTGTYHLVPNSKPNGRPLWKNSRGDRWIYCGTDDHWYIGDSEEYAAQFQCCEGYVRLAGASSGVLPHRPGGGPLWQRFFEQDSAWKTDKDVSVAVAA